MWPSKFSWSATHRHPNPINATDDARTFLPLVYMKVDCRRLMEID